MPINILIQGSYRELIKLGLILLFQTGSSGSHLYESPVFTLTEIHLAVAAEDLTFPNRFFAPKVGETVLAIPFGPAALKA